MDNILIKTQQYLSLLNYEEFARPIAIYLETLLKWNKAYNLTSIDNLDDMLTHHILDSLAIMPFIKSTLAECDNNSILDVGTGAGLPGIPMAIVDPTLNVTLLDSNGKKIRFLQEVCRILNLKNVTLEWTRVENYSISTGFSTIISRAFSDLVDFTNKTLHIINKDSGRWIAMKGQNPLHELEELKYPYKVEFYNVPKLDAKRCCVMISPIQIPIV